jgi:hypothetical protein
MAEGSKTTKSVSSAKEVLYPCIDRVIPDDHYPASFRMGRVKGYLRSKVW